MLINRNDNNNINIHKILIYLAHSLRLILIYWMDMHCPHLKLFSCVRVVNAIDIAFYRIYICNMHTSIIEFKQQP